MYNKKCLIDDAFASRQSLPDIDKLIITHKQSAAPTTTFITNELFFGYLRLYHGGYTRSLNELNLIQTLHDFRTHFIIMLQY